MKVGSINNSIQKTINFYGFPEKEERKTNLQTPVKNSNKKSKVITYSLASIAALGGAILLVNGLKHGKIKNPEIGIKKPDGKIVTTPPAPPAQEIVEEIAPKLTDDAQKALTQVQENLRRTTPRDFGDTVDEITMGATKYENEELCDLHDWYKNLELNSKKGQKLKQQIDEVLHKPEPLNPKLGEAVDERLGQKTMDLSIREKMQNFYTEMAEQAEKEAKILAEKQAKREAMLKLKEENPQEYARLKAERAKTKKLEKQQQKAAQLADNTKIVEVNGTKVKRVEEVTSGGNVVRDYSVDGDKLIREVRTEGGKTVSIVYGENSKVTYIKEENGTVVQKSFVKNEKGEYELVTREKFNSHTGETKRVTRLNDGNTQIVEMNEYGGARITIMDKKGNIISQNSITKPKAPDPKGKGDEGKVLAPWYVNYLALCKEFGVSPRACGKGGAWDHFYELSLRKNDPERYEHYMNIRRYRARYDEKARLLETLDELDNLGALDKFNYGLNLDKFTDRDLKILENYLKNLEKDSEVYAKLKTFISTLKQHFAELAQRERQRTRVSTPPRVMVYA